MPLLPGKGHVGDNIREFRSGPTYRHTEETKGKARADKQAVAVALHQQDESEGDSKWLSPAGRKK